MSTKADGGTLLLDAGGKLIGLPYCLCGHLRGSHAVGEPQPCCMDRCRCSAYHHDAALALLHDALSALMRSEHAQGRGEAPQPTEAGRRPLPHRVGSAAAPELRAQLDQVQASGDLAQPDRAGATFTTTVALHTERAGGEPIELDVDVTVTCDCGHTETERQQLYNEHDDATVMCAACGAENIISVFTVVTFKPTAAKVSDGVISSAKPEARRRVHHGP